MELSFLVRAWSTFLAQLFFIWKTSGLRDCMTTSNRCISSSDLSNERFACFGKSRLPHPTNASLYYRCPDANHFACRCACKPGKAFDELLGRCHRSQRHHGEHLRFRNRSREHAEPSGGGEPVVPVHPVSDKNSRVESGVRAADGTAQSIVIKVLPQNNATSPGGRKDSGAPPPYDVQEAVTVHRPPEAGQNGSSEQDIEPRSLTVASVEGTSGKMRTIMDDSAFPAWAIALVVLCLVIVMVLIVLIIY